MTPDVCVCMQLFVHPIIQAKMDTLLPSRPTFTLHILLEATDKGCMIASIAELPDCQVEAETRTEALAAIQKLVSDRLSQVEVLSLEVSAKEAVQENPWIEFIGMFEGDSEFAEMSAQWRAEREQHHDGV